MRSSEPIITIPKRGLVGIIVGAGILWIASMVIAVSVAVSIATDQADRPSKTPIPIASLFPSPPPEPTATPTRQYFDSIDRNMAQRAFLDFNFETSETDGKVVSFGVNSEKSIFIEIVGKETEIEKAKLIANSHWRDSDEVYGTMIFFVGIFMPGELNPVLNWIDDSTTKIQQGGRDQSGEFNEARINLKRINATQIWMITIQPA